MDLVKLNNDNTPVTTSLKVAEYFEKEHKHVMRDIRTIMETIESQGLEAESIFGLSGWKDSTGRTNKMYEMNRKGFMLLTMGFNGEKAMKLKNDFVDAFDYMEEELKKKPDPTKLTRMEILQMALEAEQKNQELEQKVTEDAPKVEAYDDFMNTDGKESMTESLKGLDLRPKNTIEWMKANGFLYKKGNKLLPCQQKQDSGFFVVKHVLLDSGTRIPQTFFTPKGIDHIAKLKRRGDLWIKCYEV